MTGSAAFASLARAARERPPQVTFVLGSGMSRLTERVHALERVSFTEVPGMTGPSVTGHRGSLLLGEWAGRRVLVFEGRLHRYEGHSWNTVVEPIRVARFLGTEVLVLTNAAGGIHDALGPGSFMLIQDHVEWTWPCSWRRPGPGGLGGPRPSPYATSLQDVFLRAANDLRIGLRPGVYAALTGPCYETPAEIRALRAWGADAVGMSTAREAQQAFDLGIRCAALSCITNRAAGLSGEPLCHEEVLTTARAQSERLLNLLDGFLGLISGG
jgi:purine-nucleoside phosphorylase